MPADPSAGFFGSFVAMADDFGQWLTTPLSASVDPFVAFSDDAASLAVTAPNAPAETGQAVGVMVDDAGRAIGDAVGSATRAASDTATTVVIWGGAALVGFMLLQRLERR